MNTLDAVTLVIVLLCTLAYFTKGRLWSKPLSSASSTAYGKAKSTATRNIVERMSESRKNAVFFYGSQTGTAEDFASRLAKEGHSRFGLKTMTADMDDYDYDSLDTFAQDWVAFFIVSTYGEGEPTDNAVEFTNFITDESSSFSEGGTADSTPLTNMKYVAFGLGNRTYEHYNAMVRKVDEALSGLGAKRISVAGEGDDGDGNLEDDFLSWKEIMWQDLSKELGLESREAVYEPELEVVEMAELDATSKSVYLGEPNKKHLDPDDIQGPFNAHNPYVAPVTTSYELFKLGRRNCIHMEIDLSGSNLTYKTGDHVAVWALNADDQVKALMDLLDLTSKKDQVIRVRAFDSTTKVPIPTPTTYSAAMRYYLEICGPVSRQFLTTVAPFAPSESIKMEVAALGNDKDRFHHEVTSKYLTLAQTLALFSPKWPNIPFSLLLESLPHLQPRYYSISSSSLAQGDKHLSITAVVESRSVTGHDNVLNGVATNYLLAVQHSMKGSSPTAFKHSYETNGPRGQYSHGTKVAVHTRKSNFKLPVDSKKPIVMVGPGTGVAPFRGFVQERVAQKQSGKEVGKTVLFFGCRNREDDFIYEKDWEHAQSALGDAFQIVTAFSRDGPQKVYVQDRLAESENAKLVSELLLDRGGHFYICGDAAHMAREVNTALAKLLGAASGKNGDDIIKSLRARGLFQEDVWS